MDKEIYDYISYSVLATLTEKGVIEESITIGEWTPDGVKYYTEQLSNSKVSA